MKLQKEISILVCIIFITISCKSTYTRVGDKNANYIPYYLKVYEADSLSIIGDYQRSHDILDSLFKKYEPINIEGYYEYFSYIENKVKIGNFNNIRKILNKSFVDYGANINTFKLDSLMNLALLKSGYFDKDLEAFQNIHNEKLNLELRSMIEKMIEKDQLVRGENFDQEKLILVNEENMKLIEYVFSNFGYPSSKKIGFSTLNGKDIDLGAVFLHCTSDFKEHYLLQKLLSFAIRGECSPRFYASVYDRLLLEKTNFEGAQLYGEFKGKKLLLIDKLTNDSIRKSIGLPSINYSLWRHNQLYGDFFKYEY